MLVGLPPERLRSIGSRGQGVLRSEVAADFLKEMGQKKGHTREVELGEFYFLEEDENQCLVGEGGSKGNPSYGCASRNLSRERSSIALSLGETTTFE